MDAWDYLRTPCHSALKVYHRAQVILRLLLLPYEMAVWHWGVPKGSRANTSSGIRGGEDETKATRTLWLVVLCSNNRHAMAPVVKNPSKINFSVPVVTKSVNSRGHQLSTSNDTHHVNLVNPVILSKTYVGFT